MATNLVEFLHFTNNIVTRFFGSQLLLLYRSYSQTSLMWTLFVETKLFAILIFRNLYVSAEKVCIYVDDLCSNFFGAYIRV